MIGGATVGSSSTHLGHMTICAMTNAVTALAAALTLSACATAPAPSAPSASVTRVVSTTSFGMCVGYCTTRLEITEGEAVLIREARGGRGAPDPSAQPQRFSAPLTPAEWQEIQRLAAAAGDEPIDLGHPDLNRAFVNGTLVADALFRAFPASSEGQKSKIKAHLVSTASLAELAEDAVIERHRFELAVAGRVELDRQAAAVGVVARRAHAARIGR